MSDTRLTPLILDASVPSAVARGDVDVEGNGQRPPDLVELAVVPIIGGNIGQPTSWLVKPPRPISPMATRIHGLTNHDVAEGPACIDIEAEIRQVLDTDILVAHNAHVDVGVLRRHLGGWECPEVLDTLKLARRLLPGRASHKLGSLAAAFSLADGLPSGLAPHRATYDAMVTARLFVHLVTAGGNGSLFISVDGREAVVLASRHFGGRRDAPAVRARV